MSDWQNDNTLTWFTSLVANWQDSISDTWFATFINALWDDLVTLWDDSVVFWDAMSDNDWETDASSSWYTKN